MQVVLLKRENKRPDKRMFSDTSFWGVCSGTQVTRLGESGTLLVRSRKQHVHVIQQHVVYSYSCALFSQHQVVWFHERGFGWGWRNSFLAQALSLC